MADIELAIKLPEEVYRYAKKYNVSSMLALREMSICMNAIANGTPLPKGHGGLIDKEELKENINGWYAFMKDVCKQPYMTLKQEEIIGKIDMMTPIIETGKEQQ